MLKFVVTRRKESQSFSSEFATDSKTDINNNNVQPQTAPSQTTTTTTALTTDNCRPSLRCKKRKRLAETRHAIILRQQKHRSLSIGGSVKSESEDEGASNSIHAWSACSTPRLVSRWNNPSADVDDFESPDDDIPPFQRYFRAASGDTPEPLKSSPITILVDKCPELSDSNLTLDGKHTSCSSFDTCISSATSSNDLSNRTESPSSSVICFGSSSKTIRLELRKRTNCKKFGFTVVGGVDSPRGPMGIYVKTVHEDGLAAGLLQKGDELTSVNGKELKDIKHSAAVNLIKSSGREGCLSLILKRFQRSMNSRCDSYDEGIVSSSTQNSPTIVSDNMTAITMRLNQLASKLEEDASPSFIPASSFDPTSFQLSSRSDGTLKSTAHSSSSEVNDNSYGDPTARTHSTQLLGTISLDLKDQDTFCCSIDNNNINSSNSNNNINNNRGLSRLMTRAAYDFGDKHGYSVLDALKLEQVFIFDC